MEDVTAKQDNTWVFPGVRYLFAVLGFLGFAANYAVKVNLNVAIVAMINSSAVYKENLNLSSSKACGTPSGSFNTSILDKYPEKNGEFLWSPKEQGIILGAFYYGYIILQLPGGRMAEMYSGKVVFGLGTFISAALSLLTPMAARLDLWSLVAVRAAEGLAQGLMFPSIFVMMGHWIPDCERGLLVGCMFCGITIGTLASMTATGFLCSSDLLGGWPSAFYIIGLFGCVWFLLWCFLITDKPQDHRFISRKELKYIISNQKRDHSNELPPFPWCKVLTSIPFWAVTIAHIGGDWGFYVILNNLPTFFATILNFDIKKNGFLSSCPYLLKTVVFMSAGGISDLLIRKNVLTLKIARKFSTVLSHIVAAAFLIGVCLAGCNTTLCIICLMGFVMFYGFNASGYSLSALDMFPEYAGTVIGVSNTISSMTGFLAPMTVGLLTNKHQTMEQWHIVFGMSAAIQAVSGIIFIIFVNSENQKLIEK